MGTTPTYGLPYQGLTDAPHGPNLGQDLAEEVEVELTRIDARFTDGSISGSRISTTIISAGSADSASVASGGSEISIGSVTASLVSGRIYRVRYVTRLATSVAGTIALVRIRENTVAGAELVGDNLYIGTSGSAGIGATMEGEFTASATGSKTFHLTLAQGGGTGTVRRESSFMPTYIYVDYIRG